MGNGVVPTNSIKKEIAWHILRLQAVCLGNPQGTVRASGGGHWPKSRGLGVTHKRLCPGDQGISVSIITHRYDTIISEVRCLRSFGTKIQS